MSALVLWLVIAAGNPAWAVGGCHDVRALTAFIADWIGDSGLPDCLTVHRSDFTARPGMVMSQGGAFDPATGTITLAGDLDLETVLGQSYLLHELVHLAQFDSGRATAAPCIGALEAEAYAIQAAWLRAHGEGREAFLLTFVSQPLITCAGPSPPVGP